MSSSYLSITLCVRPFGNLILVNLRFKEYIGGGFFKFATNIHFVVNCFVFVNGGQRQGPQSPHVHPIFLVTVMSQEHLKGISFMN